MTQAFTVINAEGSALAIIMPGGNTQQLLYLTLGDYHSITDGAEVSDLLWEYTDSGGMQKWVYSLIFNNGDVELNHEVALCPCAVYSSPSTEPIDELPPPPEEFYPVI